MLIICKELAAGTVVIFKQSNFLCISVGNIVLHAICYEAFHDGIPFILLCPVCICQCVCIYHSIFVCIYMFISIFVFIRTIVMLLYFS